MRIVQLLESTGPHTRDTFAAIQGDDYNISAEEMMPFLSGLERDRLNHPRYSPTPEMTATITSSTSTRFFMRSPLSIEAEILIRLPGDDRAEGRLPESRREAAFPDDAPAEAGTPNLGHGRFRAVLTTRKDLVFWDCPENDALQRPLVCSNI